MKLRETPRIKLPNDIDYFCIDLCNLLNRLPGVQTFESCCGHGTQPYCVWFRCDNIDTLSRLGRAVNKNYSDGNWEIVIDSCDGDPRGVFWLRSKGPWHRTELNDSLGHLIENIEYWFKDDFDDYFKNK